MLKHKLFLSILSATVILPVITVPAHAGTTEILFTDLSLDYYAVEEVTELASKGVLNGYADGYFRPNEKVTRAQFAAFVARALDLPAAESNFKDVGKSMALYDGVSRAYKAGIIRGFSDGTFKPNVTVNREDMAVMLDRALQYKGSYTKTKALDFKDTSKIGNYSKRSVERMYAYNIMGSQNKNNEFNGSGIGTRVETALSIYNLLQVLDGEVLDTPKQPPVENVKPTPPPKYDPEKNKDGYVTGDVITVNGFKFTLSNVHVWTNEFGAVSGMDIPKPSSKRYKKGYKYPFRADLSSEQLSSYEYGLIFTDGFPYNKNGILSIVDEVRKTKKVIYSKDFKFYIDPYNSTTVRAEVVK